MPRDEGPGGPGLQAGTSLGGTGVFREEKMEGNGGLRDAVVAELGEIEWEWGTEDSKMIPRLLEEPLGSILLNFSLNRFGN